MTLDDLPARHGIVTAADAERIAREQRVDLPSLMVRMLPAAAELARPPVSNFRVGAIARGTTTGNLYFGANLEFAGEALSFTVHAEQSSVTNAWMHGEEGVDFIAVNAPPCGYCRQFLNELSTARNLSISIAGRVRTLDQLLPDSFGPRDLEVTTALMLPAAHGLTIDDDDEVARIATAAANRSHAPYSHAYAGVALRAAGGTIVGGAYAENAAFNPSMSPLEVALSMLNLRGLGWSDIAEAVLVQNGTLHTAATRTVLGAVSTAPLRVISARNSTPPPSR